MNRSAFTPLLNSTCNKYNKAPLKRPSPNESTTNTRLEVSAEPRMAGADGEGV